MVYDIFWHMTYVIKCHIIPLCHNAIFQTKADFWPNIMGFAPFVRALRMDEKLKKKYGWMDGDEV